MEKARCCVALVEEVGDARLPMGDSCDCGPLVGGGLPCDASQKIRDEVETVHGLVVMAACCWHPQV